MYRGVSVVVIVFVSLIVSEKMGRSREELDELFHSKVKPGRSNKFVGTSIGAQITNMQDVNEGDTALKIFEDAEEVQEADRNRKVAA